MEWLKIWALILLVVLLLIVYWYVNIPKNLPPGPVGWPLLGYIAPFIGSELYETFNYLAEKYGNIFHFYLGSQLLVVLNDFDIIKEGFIKQGDAFAGRLKFKHRFDILDQWFQGVTFTEGEYWKQHRRFILHSLKDNGVGKSALELPIMDEIHHFLKEIEDQNGQPLRMLELCAMTMSNNIHQLVTGRRFDYNDPMIRQIIKSLKKFESLTVDVKYMLAFPWAMHIYRFIFQSSVKKGQKINNRIVQLITTVLKDVRDKCESGPSDTYMQSYMVERENRLRKNSKENIFTEKGIIFNTRDMLIAGADSTGTTLVWAAIYMILYPDVQKKVQQEIDQAIGRNREPTYNDKLNTPYTEATILEIHRFASVVPCAIPHRSVKSTILRGYNIPENTIVYANLWAVHNDPKLWGDPKNFRPERFLNSNGECVKPEYLIPFSIGKRICPGESLARMELYLYFVCLLQRFNFVSPNGEKPSLASVQHLVVTPQSDLIRFQLRKD